MSAALDVRVDALTEEQLAALFAHVKKNPKVGTVAAARAVGVAGTKGEIRALLADLGEELREARGWNIRAVEATIWAVALNPEHPHWERAAGRLVRAYGGPQFREDGHLTLSGPDGGPVLIEDRSASLADVAKVLQLVGALAQLGGGADRPEVSAPARLLPAPGDD